MGTVLSTTKLSGGSMKTIERRAVRMVTEMPDGKPIVVYLEQQDVTLIDGEPVGYQNLEPVVIGPKDVAEDSHLNTLQEVATALDDRVAVNEVNKTERAKAIADAELAKADAEEIAIVDDKV